MPDTAVNLLATLLAAGPEGFVSGQELARRLGMSRVSVWARLQKLQNEGLVFEAVRGRGYRLGAEPNVLHPALLSAYLRRRRVHTLAPGLKVIFLPEIDSTNLEAERRLAAGARGPLVIFAARQTAGRGRLGRSWYSANAGSLYVSFAFQPKLPPARMPKFTLWMGLRLCQFLQDTYNLPVRLKWPNDIVHEGRKLAGLLTEARIDADLMHDLICGVGLNVNGDPARWAATRSAAGVAAAKVAATLQQLNGDKPLPLNAVAADITIAGARAYADFVSGRFEAEFDALWARFDILRGCDVNVALHEGNLHGRAGGLDASGGLRLVLADGSRRVLQSGDVTLGGYDEKK